MTTRRSFLFRGIPSVTALSLVNLGPTFALEQSKTRPASDGSADLSASELRPYIERFFLDRSLLERYYNLPFSDETLQQLRTYHGEWHTRLMKFDFDPLSHDGKIDFILFRNHLQHSLDQLQLNADLKNAAEPYIPFAKAIIALIAKQRAMEPVNPKESASALSDLEHACATSRKSLEDKLASGASGSQDISTQRSREAANHALENLNELRRALSAWYKFYDGYDPMFTWWVEQPYRSADVALNTYADFLATKVIRLPSAEGAPRVAASGTPENAFAASMQNAKPGDSSDIIGTAVGREALLRELQYAMIPYSPEELISIAEDEFAKNDRAMAQASREMGFGDNWREALNKIESMYLEPGQQTALARKYVLESLAFIDKHDLVTVPPLARETWRMRMMPPQQMLVSPFFLGGEVLQVASPTNTMSYDQRIDTLRANNVPMSHAVVFHETIPGHELQGFMEQRYRSYRQAFGGTPFLIEGWALYWEMLYLELGFDRTPEERLGALMWRRHRCARIIFSLNFHLGKWTPQQCIDFLVDRVGWARPEATGEVRRSFGGAYSPLYQAAYLLGGMQIHSLRKELVDSGKMTNREFHDAVLRENSIPIEMIRASLTDQKLTKDYVTQWKFYGARVS